MDPEPQLSIAILAESDQEILMIFDCELWQPITLQQIVIERIIVIHLKDQIHIYLEQEDQDLIWTFKVLYLSVKWPHFTS